MSPVRLYHSLVIQTIFQSRYPYTNLGIALTLPSSIIRLWASEPEAEVMRMKVLNHKEGSIALAKLSSNK